MRQSFTDFIKRQEGDGRFANPYDRITDNTVMVTGTDAGEREDFMIEKIREYSMNGALIIGVDNGYGNMKTARRCFKTAIAKYDSAPVLSRDYIGYSCAVTPQIRQTGNRLSGNAGTAYASLLA